MEQAGRRRRRGHTPRWLGWLSLVAALLGIVAVAIMWRPALAPIEAVPRFEPGLVERGARVAALGTCAACHTVDPARPFAGGLPIETPFGTVYSTNITPDARTGIGG